MLATSLIAMRARRPTTASTFPHAASAASYGGMKTCDHGVPEVCHIVGTDVLHSRLMIEIDIELGLEPTLAMIVFIILGH
jgi:hypothetical protein